MLETENAFIQPKMLPDFRSLDQVKMGNKLIVDSVDVKAAFNTELTGLVIIS